MRGLAIINSFIDSQAFSELYASLKRAFNEKSASLTIKGNAEILVDTGSCQKEDYDFILFWDKDILLARQLENLGYKLFNGAAAIEAADDKGYTSIVLNKAGVLMPRTILAPLTYPGVGYKDIGFLDKAENILGFPMILKKNKGSFGRDVYLINNKQELTKKVKELEGESILFQEYIGAESDIRIYVVGEKAVAAAEKFPAKGDFRSNFSLGGTMRAYTPSSEESLLAVKAAKALGLKFAGVDIIKRENGEPLILEVNSNAHFKGLSETTGVDIALSISDYIIKESR